MRRMISTFRRPAGSRVTLARPLLLSLGLLAGLSLACHSGEHADHEADATPAPSIAAAPVPTAAPLASPAANTLANGSGLLKRLEAGDRACYVVLDSGAGEQSLPGDFELCPGGQHDASPLVGGRVAYTTRKDKIQAESCQGDPACADSEEVELVATLTASPG
jgi:hypothetical protein